MPATRSRKITRSQSAMEYLMTYGWAILIIAVVLGVLFQLGIFSGSSLTPKAQPGSCEVQRLLGQASLEGLCQGQLPQFVAQFSSSYIYLGQLPGFPTGKPVPQITFAAWIKTTTTSFESIEGLRGAAFEIGRSGQLFFHGCSPADEAINVNTNIDLSNGAWHFIALSYNYPGNSLIGFVDGYSANTAINPTEASISSPNTAMIGNDVCDSGPDFTGSMADMQMYNASLSANELQALYQEGIGGTPVRIQNLIGWWPLNGNANDYSGNNNNGQINGQVSFNSTWSSAYTAP